MTQLEIRPAREADLPALLALLNREIAEGVAHFGTEPIGLEEASAEWRARRERYPTFAAITDEELVGFARAGPYKPRGAYAWTVELGVYVGPDQQGRGVGSALYAALFPALEQRGFRTLLAGITLPNPASVRLHEAFGMTRVGLLPRVGFKQGAWRDVGVWVGHLGDPDRAPDPAGLQG